MSHANDYNANTEHRAFERHVIRGEGRLTPLNEHELHAGPIGVMLHDICRSGVLFEADRPLEPGSTWRLNFVQRGHVIDSQPVTVRRCAECGGGVFRIGASFIVEPRVLHALGVNPTRLFNDDLRFDDVSESFAFVAPQAL